MINYNSKEEIKQFLEDRGLGMRKKYGQNFMINPMVRAKLLDALEIQAGSRVWEIGPGLGAMTAGLLERSAELTVFEIDPAFARIIRENFGSAIRLVEGDVLKTWPSIEAGEELFLFGNLPYNIAAALLADFTEKGRFFARIVVTVQREVAQRMWAKPGTPGYSSFSVLCSSAYKVSPLQVIHRSSFYPAPRVDSQGVRMDLLPGKGKRPELFYPLVRRLFSARRKTIRNSLSIYISQVIMSGGAAVSPKEITAEVLSRAHINGDCRAETLGIEEFDALAVSLEEIIAHGF